MHNPILNALLATLYIIGVVTTLEYITGTLGPVESLLTPIIMLSLFVLSAAVMGYLFLFGPGELYFSGKKAEAVRLFLSTVLVFGCITALLVGVLFIGGVKGATFSVFGSP